MGISKRDRDIQRQSPGARCHRNPAAAHVQSAARAVREGRWICGGHGESFGHNVAPQSHGGKSARRGVSGDKNVGGGAGNECGVRVGTQRERFPVAGAANDIVLRINSVVAPGPCGLIIRDIATDPVGVRKSRREYRRDGHGGGRFGEGVRVI